MSMKPGTRIGPYEILAPLGAGGMGEVYRARDPRLGRDVAIKALPPAFAQDPERLARFEREARLLASLTHANIAGILGLEEAGGARYLVLEFVEGETLAARLARGPLPVDETLDIALQIALGVEAAHESGVVHRDLKPGNVMLTPSGAVKVLDFGLARAGATDRGGADPNLSASPTVTHAATQAGVILGTAAYMSPEQARGKAVDRRTDIWSFGCVVYECLTGRPLFQGETVSDLIAKILERDPDWSPLPAGTPARVRDLLQRCLRRDPRERLRDMGDARIALAEARLPGAEAAAADTARARRAPLWIWALVALGGAAAGLALGSRLSVRPQSAAPLRRFTIPATSLQASFNSHPMISPDGRRIVYANDSRLLIRDLENVEPVELPGTEGAYTPFWSFDGTQLGFSRDHQLYVASLSGANHTVLCTLPNSGSTNGAVWGNDGKIVFAMFRGGLYEVPERGGEPQLIMMPDTSEVDFHHPDLLPGGEHILALAHSKQGENSVAVVSRRDRSRKNAGAYAASSVAFSATGHLLINNDLDRQQVLAVAFSPQKRAITGEPFLILAGAIYPSVSRDGTVMTYSIGALRELRELVRIDRDGRVDAVLGAAQQGLSQPTVSPDGHSVALVAAGNDNADIWIQDLARGTRRRLVSSPRENSYPVWVDDRRLIYCEGGNVIPALMEVAVDGSDAPKPLGVDGYYPTRVPGGATVVFNTDLSGQSVLWRMDDGEKPVALTRGKETNEDLPALSPDGRWLAYLSNVSGTMQVFVRRFPDGTAPQQVSRAAGGFPFWSPRGDALYFLERGALMEVQVRAGTALELGEPRLLFHTAGLETGEERAGIAPTADGYFIAVRRAASDPFSGVLVVENWFEEFRRP